MNIKRITFLILLTASFLLMTQEVYAAVPKGTHDGVNNNSCITTGWAYDPDTPSSSISVDIYRDGGAGNGVSLGRFTANVYRSDVNAAFGISGNHGFNISLSSWLSDGKSHPLYIYAIDSSGTGTNPLISNSPKTIQCAAPAPTLSVSVNPSSITAGRSTTFSWLSSNATSCTGSLGGSYGTSGSFSETLYSTKTYGMNCTGAGGSSGFKYATVTVSAPISAPEVFLNTDKSTITSGDSIKLSWSVRNTPTSCWASESWSGGKTIPANNAWASETFVPSGTGVKRYSFTCNNSAGQSNTASVNVTVNPKVAVPEVFLNTDKSTITSGDSIKLSWSVRNTPTSCWASESWSGGKTIPANNAWASETFVPSGTGVKRYSFTCNNSAGQSNTASVNVTVNPKPVEPTPGVPVPLNVPGGNGPITKLANQSLTLNWGVANVTNWTITSATGNFSRSGGAVGATPQYCGNTTSPSTCVTFEPPAPPAGTYEVTHVYTIAGFGSEVRDSLEVVVRNQQCRDGRDNDGDGLRDYPADPGCSAPSDNDETNAGAPQCGDGADNDGDGKIDYPADPGCSSSSDNDEFDAPVPVPQCRDSADNDGDGKIDYPNDPGCSGTEDNDETNPLPPVINVFEAVSGGSAACNLDANPKLLVAPKNTSTLTWSCDRVISGCTLHDDNPKVLDMGAVSSSGSRVTSPIDATTTFTLQCPSVTDTSVKVRLFDPFLKEVIPQ